MIYALLPLLFVGEATTTKNITIVNEYVRPTVQVNDELIFVRPVWTKTATIDPKFLATESIALESILYQTNKLSK